MNKSVGVGLSNDPFLWGIDNIRDNGFILANSRQSNFLGQVIIDLFCSYTYFFWDMTFLLVSNWNMTQ